MGLFSRTSLYAMNIDEARAKLLLSFEDEPQLITPKGKNYKEYVEEKKNQLLGFVISPVIGTVVGASMPVYDYAKYKSAKVWVIANWQDNWLITLDNEQEFALAYGESPHQLNMLGFSSSDALAEWLG